MGKDAVEAISEVQEQEELFGIFLNSIPAGLSEDQKNDLFLKAKGLKRDRRITSSHLSKIKNKLDENIAVNLD